MRSRAEEELNVARGRIVELEKYREEKAKHDKTENEGEISSCKKINADEGLSATAKLNDEEEDVKYVVKSMSWRVKPTY